uniref:Uncharacterized protein n=1 Tax=Solanum tuberosum TaxID=4113 RepID=M1CVD6_SOLTU
MASTATICFAPIFLHIQKREKMEAKILKQAIQIPNQINNSENIEKSAHTLNSNSVSHNQME